MSETKRNHYVSQFYISQWKFNDNKRVYCLKKDESRIFESNTKEILAEKGIWDDKVEKAFAQTEGGPWIRIRNKILKNKTMDLSEGDLESFLSFIFALEIRKKENVDEYHEGVDYANAEFDNKCIKDGKLTKKEVVEIQRHDNDMFNHFLLSAFNPNKLSLPLRYFKRFSFGVKTIREQDTEYGQFFTSDSPLLVKRRSSGGFLFQIIEACLMIALSPNLLVFGAIGAKGETFVALNNKPIDIIIKNFNQEIYNKSKYIISNKKSFLEQFLS